MNSIKLSVVISTKNSEKIIKRAVESVTFADEIVVVDMESDDKTIEIAKKYTDRIFSHKDHGYIEPARNFSLSKARGEWILLLDADEEVSPGLKKAVLGVVNAKEQTQLPDCFYLPRKNIIFNKWIQKTGWWPDYQLRFFRNGQVEWPVEIHSVPITKGEVKEFPPKEELALIHHNYQSIIQFIKRLNHYSSIQAKECKSQKKITDSQILDEFFSSFLQRLFSQEGIEEGTHGVSLSILQATADAAVKMKLWEQQGFPQLNKEDSSRALASVTRFKKELSYWIATEQIKQSLGIKKLWWQLRRKVMI